MTEALTILNKELKDAQFKKAFMKTAIDNLEHDLGIIEQEIEEIMTQIMRLQTDVQCCE